MDDPMVLAQSLIASLQRELKRCEEDKAMLRALLKNNDVVETQLITENSRLRVAMAVASEHVMVKGSPVEDILLDALEI